jgi:peptidoglycan/xylan/chitin deacetylase (PgdA/CDA1 family)
MKQRAQIIKINKKIWQSFEVNMLSKNIYFHGNRKAKKIALSFDDGPCGDTLNVLKVLKKYKIKATFFVLGKKIKGNEKLLKQMLRQGCEVGNHTYSHNRLIFKSISKVMAEIKSTDFLLNKNGIKTSLLRFPYFSMDVFSFIAAKRLGKKIIFADIDSLDWYYKDKEKIIRRVLRKIMGGSIMGFHDYLENIGRNYKLFYILEKVIPALQRQGYKFVTISELFGFNNFKK